MTRCAVLVFGAVLLLALDLRGQQVGPGYWLPPFNHVDPQNVFMAPLPSGNGPKFIAVHMSLIPKGPNRGKILIWDHHYGNQGMSMWEQRWSILDLPPGGAPVFENGSMMLTAQQGDIFCSGMTWMPNGELFVAGGTSQYSTAYTTSFLGGSLAFRYDPMISGNAAWIQLPDLALPRWYPTTTLMPDGRVVVSGGVTTTLTPPTGQPSGATLANNMEIWDPATNAWAVNPSASATANPHLFAGSPTPMQALSIYPRFLVMPSGRVFRAGMNEKSGAFSLTGNAVTWTPLDTASNRVYRTYNTAVPMPKTLGQPETVMMMGGQVGSNAPLATMLYCKPDAQLAAEYKWSSGASMNYNRECFNATLLPDGTVFVVGGRSSATTPWAYPYTPEIFRGDAATGAFYPAAPHISPRQYHSTSLLLPDGRVLVGGGESRTNDYEIYIPPYLAANLPRPEIQKIDEEVGYAQQAALKFEFAAGGDDSVQKVVLMRPGSVTHHFDNDQKSIEVPILDITDNVLTYATPANHAEAKPGYWMVFLVSKRGIPSVAGWIHLL